MRNIDLKAQLDEYPDDAEVAIIYSDSASGYTYSDPDFDVNYIPVTNEIRLK